MKALITAFFFLLIAGNASVASPYLIVVSFDGFRHDYFNRATLPVIEGMLQNGFRAESLIPVFPSQTFPSHYSMITGLTPVRHGIVMNRFYDQQTKKTFRMSDRDMVADTIYFRGVPVWEQLLNQGIITASYHWVGSEAHHPHDWHPYKVGTPDSVRMNQLTQWMSRPYPDRPKAYFMYFEFLDDIGHWYGPESAEIDTILPRADKIMESIFSIIDKSGLQDSVNVLVVSDHGMTTLDSVNTIDLNKLEQWYDGQALIIPNYSIVSVYAAKDQPLKPPPAISGVTWLDSTQYPGPFSFRFGNYLGIADIGKVFSWKGKSLTNSKGGHGYFSRAKDMHGVFFGTGPAFKSGIVLPSVNGVDLYALCRHLMGLPEDLNADGRMDLLYPALRKNTTKN